MRIAFIVLAHQHPEQVLRLVQHLLADGNEVVLHWDKNNPEDLRANAQALLPKSHSTKLHFAPRHKIIWGDWSMVAATLACLQLIQQKRLTVDYVVLLSGADYLLKPLRVLKQFLSAQGKDFIECVNPEQERWVVQGLVQDRYWYHHWFNWRHQRGLFEFCLAWQKKLGLKRRFPRELTPYFGSQWWGLRWSTVVKLLALTQNKRLLGFFKTTWVPDELFFQTLVAFCVPAHECVKQSLTFYQFTEQGNALTFYNDHLAFLLQQEFFFVRKLSPYADALRAGLDNHLAHYQSSVPHHLNKHLASLQHFMSVQWRGLPNRRVIGRQLDAWYGDLEWNKTPYFVILAYHGVDLEPLRLALNQQAGLRCYRELYHGGFIDYGLPLTHPLYPADKPALRDMKRPNFLVDLLHTQPQQLTGFILRLPCGHEMDKVVVFDPQASLIFVMPEDYYYDIETQQLNWSKAFDNMIMSDYLADIRSANKNVFIIKTQQHQLVNTDIQAVLTHLQTQGMNA